MPSHRLPARQAWFAYAGTWSFLGSLSWTTAAVYLIRDVGMSPLQLVLAGTALEIAYFLSEVPTGVLADLYSRRLSLVVAAGVCGFGMLVVGLADAPVVVLAGMALWGFGWTFRSGAEDAWLADEVGVSGLASAYQRGAQVERLAGLGGIAAAVVLAMADLSFPLVSAAGVALLLGIFLAVAMPEQGFQRPARAEVHLGLRAAALGTVKGGVRVVRGYPVLLLVLAFAFVAGAWGEGWDRLWEAHLLTEVGLPELFGLDPVVWFGVIAAGTLLLSFALAAPLVSRLERLQEASLPRLLLVLQSLLILTALAFALTSQLWPALAAYWATTVLRSLSDAPYRTWLNSSIKDSSTRATVLSIANIAGSGGEWAGGPALGWIGTRWGVRWALAVGAAALTPAVLLLTAASRRSVETPVVRRTGGTSP